MNVTEANTKEMNEAERREAVEDAPGLADPDDSDDEEMVAVVSEGGE